MTESNTTENYDKKKQTNNILLYPLGNDIFASIQCFDQGGGGTVLNINRYAAINVGNKNKTVVIPKRSVWNLSHKQFRRLQFILEKIYCGQKLSDDQDGPER